MKKLSIGYTFQLDMITDVRKFTVVNLIEGPLRVYELFEHGPDLIKYFNADILERYVYVTGAFLKPVKTIPSYLN